MASPEIRHCIGPMVSPLNTPLNGTFLYSTVSSPHDCSERFTLHPLFTLHPSIPVHSNTNSTSLKHSASVQLLRDDYSFIYPPFFIARYSFIQLRELEQRGVNEIVQASKRRQVDSKPGSLDRESDLLKTGSDETVCVVFFVSYS